MEMDKENIRTERRRAREIAFHIVYERSFSESTTEEILDMRLNEDAFQALAGEAEAYDRVLPPDDCVFVRKLTSMVEEHRPELDQMIASHSTNWRIDRIARVNRAILEIACCEIRFFDDIDLSVSINEAVNLAKKYGTEDAGAFINGVLGGIARSENSVVPEAVKDSSEG